MERTIQSIKISDIDLDTSQPRQVIEEDKIKDLADDIKEAGQLVPIILTYCYKKGDTLVIGKLAHNHPNARYFVLDGYRRILANNIIGNKTIDAEIKIELDALSALEVQFRANSKRVQVTVKEMALAIQRYATEWKTQGKKGDIVSRLSKLTGYSTTYFDMANAIVNEDKAIKKLIYADKVGAYYSAEKKNVSKDKNIKDGMDDGVKEYTSKTGKKVGALTPRVLKPDFRKIEKTVKEPERRRILAKSKTLEYLNRSLEVEDENSNYEAYLYSAQEFYDKIKRWNIKGLSAKQIESITEAIMKSVTYLREEKRKCNKLPKGKGKKTENL